MRNLQYCIFLCLVSLLAGCKSDTSRHENVFNWNIAAGFTSMDPAFANVQPNIWVVNQIFNGLVQLDDQMQLQPCIARSWETSEDGRSLTFHLRQDVYFHDNEVFPSGKGRKLVAGDIVYTFNRLIDPATAGKGVWIFNGKVDIDTVSNKGSFFADNDSTFRLVLIQPFRPMLQMLSLNLCNIVPHEAVEKYGKDFRAHPVGTGPFMLKYFYEGERVVLHRNEHYFETEHNIQLPYLDAVVISFVPSKQNEFFAFTKGELNLMSGLDKSFKDNLLQRNGQMKEKFKGRFHFEVVPFLNTEYLGFQLDSTLNDNKALLNPKVRQAMNYAIDREKMLRFLRNNIGEAGYRGFVPPYLFNNTFSDTFYKYEPARARQLLAEAGYPSGEGIAPISLATTDNYLDMAVYVQKQLEEIGLEIKVENMPASSLSQMKAQGKAAFFRASWIADYADPENYLSLFYSPYWSPAGSNYFHYKNSAYDNLYTAALAENDDARRYKLYRQMQQLLMEDAPVIVLYYDEVVRLVDNKVKGLTPNPINLISLKKVRME